MKINIIMTNKFKFFLISVVILILVISIWTIKILIRNNAGKININAGDIIFNDITEKSCFPADVYGVAVNGALVDSGTKARPGVKRKIKYIVIHETGNFSKGANAKNHAQYLLRTSKRDYTSWHYTVDEHEIYHHIPDNEIAFHAASKIGNYYGVGIEICVNEDGNFNTSFENAVKLVAYLIKEYELDIDSIKTHNDFSGKDCPHIILKYNRLDEFKNKVMELIN